MLLLFLPLSQWIYYTILTLQRKNWCFNFYKLQRQRSTVSKWKPIYPETAQGICPGSIHHACYIASTLATSISHFRCGGRHAHRHTQTCSASSLKITRTTIWKEFLCLWEPSKTLWKTWREMILTKEPKKKKETWKWTEVLKCVGVEKAISERNREGRLTQSNQNSLVS